MPGDIAALLAEFKPRDLSDIDFVVLIGGPRAPGCLSDEATFRLVHSRACELIERALVHWVRCLDRGLEDGTAPVNFSDLFKEAEGLGSATLGSELAKRLNA